MLQRFLLDSIFLSSPSGHVPSGQDSPPHPLCRPLCRRLCRHRRLLRQQIHHGLTLPVREVLLAQLYSSTAVGVVGLASLGATFPYVHPEPGAVPHTRSHHEYVGFELLAGCPELLQQQHNILLRTRGGGGVGNLGGRGTETTSIHTNTTILMISSPSTHRPTSFPTPCI